MKVLTFSLFVIAVVFILGCSAENPICSTNFCAIGEVFPRSELEDGQLFSEVDIDDSVIFATLTGAATSAETIQPALDDSVTLADIVADVAAGGTIYAGKIVRITGTVDDVFESGGMILLTNNEDVTFFVSNSENPELLIQYKEKQTYDFTLFINKIEPPEELYPEYAIWSNVPKDTQIISVNFGDVVSKVAQGNSDYVSKFLRFTATIRNDASIFTTTDTVSLVTDNTSVSFLISNRTFPPAIMNQYEKGKSYDFTVFVGAIRESDVLGYSVHTNIVIE